MPVCRMDCPDRADNKEQHDCNLGENDQIIEPCRFLDPDDQQGGDKGNDDDGGQVENGGDLLQRGRVCAGGPDLFRQPGAQSGPARCHFQSRGQGGRDVNQVRAPGRGELRRNLNPKVPKE